MPARNRSFTLSLRISFPLVFHLSAVYPADSCYYLGQFPSVRASHTCAIPRISPLRIVARLYVVQGHLGTVLLWRYTSLRLKAVSPAADSPLSPSRLKHPPNHTGGQFLRRCLPSVTRLLTFRPSRSTVTRSLISMISPDGG